MLAERRAQLTARQWPDRLAVFQVDKRHARSPEESPTIERTLTVGFVAQAARLSVRSGSPHYDADPFTTDLLTIF